MEKAPLASVGLLEMAAHGLPVVGVQIALT
jgi:hypothetical protein